MKANKRRLAICLSSSHTAPNEYQHMLHSLLPCKVIYSKEYQHGTLFALVFLKQTSVGIMDKQIVFLDQSLQKNSGVTKFTSITDVLNGKIKSFGVGEHLTDEHYKAMFTSEILYCRGDPTIHQDVKAWYPENSGANEDGVASITDDENDEAPAQTPSSGKNPATTPKKRKLQNGDPASVSDFEAVTPVEQVHALRLELEELKQEIEELRTEMDKYADQVTDLSTELADSKGAVREIKERLEKRKSDMRKYRTENDNLKEALTHAENENTTLKQTAELNLKEALTHAEEEIKTLKQALELRNLSISTDDAIMSTRIQVEKPKPVDPDAEEGEEECIEQVMSMGYVPAPSILDIRTRYRRHMQYSKHKRPSAACDTVCNAMKFTYQNAKLLEPMPKAIKSNTELEQLKIQLAKAEEINAKLQQKVDEHNPARETSDDPFILRVWSIGNDPIPTIAELNGCVARAIQADIDFFPADPRVTLAVVHQRLYAYYQMLFYDKKNDPKVPAKPSLQMQLKAAESKMKEMHKQLYMEDGETWIEFYKNKYYSQLITDYATGEPYVNPLTGEVTTKSEKYEEELNKALAKIDEFQMMMPSAQTNLLLASAQKKARQFKRKYRYTKAYLDENHYVSDIEDEFCDSDKVINYLHVYFIQILLSILSQGKDEDSDDELRAGGPRPIVIPYDMASGIPFGFSLAPSTED